MFANNLLGVEKRLPMEKQSLFSRDVHLISFSAFFADLGYQGVTTLFPLVIILHRRAAVYIFMD